MNQRKSIKFGHYRLYLIGRQSQTIPIIPFHSHFNRIGCFGIFELFKPDSDIREVIEIFVLVFGNHLFRSFITNGIDNKLGIIRTRHLRSITSMETRRTVTFKRSYRNNSTILPKYGLQTIRHSGCLFECRTKRHTYFHRKLITLGKRH